MQNKRSGLFAGYMFLLLFSASFVHAGPMDYWRNPVPIEKVAKKDQICFALYTVHNNILKMTVQLYPLSPEDSRQVFLEIKKDGTWQRISEGTVRENYYTQGGQFEAKAWNLLFRVEDWDHRKDYPYRIVALEDLAGLADHWLSFGCTDTPTCGGADLDGDMNVTLSDFAILAQNWALQ